MPKALPSLILFHKGQVLANHVGVITQDELNNFLTTHMNAGSSRTASTSKTTNKEEQETESSEKEKKAGFISLGGMNVNDDYMLT